MIGCRLGWPISIPIAFPAFAKERPRRIGSDALVLASFVASLRKMRFLPVCSHEEALYDRALVKEAAATRRGGSPEMWVSRLSR